MIEAKKSKLFAWMFNLIFKRLIKKSFNQILLRHADIPSGGAVFIANHSNWWDGLLFFKLQQTLKKDVYVMMHEHNLKKFFFFQWLGAFSVNQKHPKSVVASLQYAGKLLQDNQVVCLFPQGDEYHLEKRPLKLDSGAIYLIEKIKQTPIVPISFYYGWAGERKPNIWIDMGTPIYWNDLSGSNRVEKNQELEHILTAQLDQLRLTIIQQQWDDFKQI